MVHATKSRFMVSLLHQFTVLFLAVHPDHLYMIIDSPDTVEGKVYLCLTPGKSHSPCLSSHLVLYSPIILCYYDRINMINNHTFTPALQHHSDLC